MKLKEARADSVPQESPKPCPFYEDELYNLYVCHGLSFDNLGKRGGGSADDARRWLAQVGLLDGDLYHLDIQESGRYVTFTPFTHRREPKVDTTPKKSGNKKIVTCANPNCGRTFERYASACRSDKLYCSRSCSATSIKMDLYKKKPATLPYPAWVLRLAEKMRSRKERI